TLFRSKDMQDLKELVESIFIGKEDPVAALISFSNGGSSYVQRLKTEDQVRNLGFPAEVAPLILEFYHAKTADEMCQLCKKLLERLVT
ncbi:MAG: hypothetical protein LLG04_08910, partial [Parachlamydia sp.]|nr:hypothetical protein [Parachlamydia sp.]